MIKEDQYFIVNYHYVLDPVLHPRLEGIYPVLPDDFRDQVRFLCGNFKIVTVEELYHAARENLAGRFCSLTFDDGLKEHANFVLATLKEYKAPGTFFVITIPLAGRIPLAHKIHCLRSKYSVPELAEFYRCFAQERYPDLLKTHAVKENSPRPASKIKVYDDALTASFKVAMSRLSPAVSQEFADLLWSKCGWDSKYEQSMAREMFLSAEEIKEMVRRGMAIGCHTHSHNALGLLDNKAAKSDILNSQKILSDITGHRINLFSYPHGIYSSKDGDMLKELGFNYAVTTERRGLSEADYPLQIPRYDVRDLENAKLLNIGN
ncbi:MAG: polysaccharide deacetylase family protein [Parcubacteria group bacterium]|nr:polysaccharide deacetylase family protein [Parcubacteria group bacterium]